MAGNENIEGAKKQNTDSDKRQGHGIMDYYDQIKNLPTGRYWIDENGTLVPRK